MQKISIIILLAMFASCVQPTYKRIVVLTVDVSKQANIKSVGIRGEGTPLSWSEDYAMKTLVKDSLYQCTLEINTGYLYGECKFTVNGQFELQEADNRRIYFSDQDTTYYRAVFDQTSVQ